MIKIKILSCPNKEIIGSVEFFSNIIEIGSSNGDVLLLSKDYMNHLFYLEAIENHIQIIPNPNLDHYLVNGKRSLSQRKLEKGDEITYKDFHFKVEDFLFDPPKDFEKIISENFSNLNEEDDLYQILINLDQELVDIEDANN